MLVHGNTVLFSLPQIIRMVRCWAYTGATTRRDKQTAAIVRTGFLFMIVPPQRRSCAGRESRLWRPGGVTPYGNANTNNVSPAIAATYCLPFTAYVIGFWRTCAPTEAFHNKVPVRAS